MSERSEEHGTPEPADSVGDAVLLDRCLELVHRGVDEEAIGPSSLVGEYVLVRELGTGGQGTVYLAEDTRLERQVALKILNNVRLSGDALERFRREATITSRLEHPSIASVYDSGTHRGRPWLAMRYVPGETLDALLRKRRRVFAPESATVAEFAEVDPSELPGTVMTQDLVLRLMATIARALHVAHEVGVVHRDVKPGNIMVTKDGEAILLDFGIACALEGFPDLTRTGEIFGTPAYMSPEQIDPMTKRVDARSDIFSLGVTAYEALTHHRPFKGVTREALLDAIVRTPHEDPRRFVAMHTDLKVVLDTALAKSKDHRYETAAAFAEDLARVRRGEPVLARPVGWPRRAARWIRREPVKACLVLTVATVIGLMGYLIARWPELTWAERASRRDEADRAVELGFLRLAEGSSETARTAFLAALGHVGDHSEALAGLTLSLLKLGEKEEALRCLEGASRRTNLHPGLETLRREILAELGRPERGVTPKAARASDPFGWFLAGQRLVDHEENDASRNREAVRLLRLSVLSSRPSPPVYLFELAHAVGHLNEPKEALDLAETILDLWPRSSVAWYWAGFLFQDTGGKKALEAYQKSLDLSPDEPTVLTALATHLNVLGRHAEAEPHASRLVHLAPDQWLSWFVLGSTHYQMRQFDLAAKALERSRVLRPSSGKILRILALARLQSGHPEEGMSDLRASLVLEDSHEAHGNLGQVLVSQGRFAEALPHLERAVKLRPDIGAQRYDLGTLYLRLDRNEDAARELARAVELDRDSAPAWNHLGLALRRLGKLEAARDAHRRSVELDPQGAEAWSGLGRVLRELGDYRGSCKSYEQAHTVGSSQQGWKHPSKRWLEDARRLLGLFDRIETLTTLPDEASEAMELASIARTARRWREAVRLYDRAFALEPALLARPSEGVAAAECALRAAALESGGPEAAVERQRALAWLEASVSAMRERQARGRLPTAALTKGLAELTEVPELMALRDRATLDKLGKDERRRWTELWEAICALREAQ